jgi:ATP-dependent helicase/nuclease subunit A
MSGDIVHPEWVTSHLQVSMAVSAGAGSGKTTSLVGRVAALLRLPEVNTSQLVVITFTEKAAREVAHKLRVALPDVALDEAYVGTIHGFCQSILRRFPIEAGLPPKFTTADELTSAVQADARASQALREFFDLAPTMPEVQQSLDVLAMFGALGWLSVLALQIDNDWARWEHAERPAPSLAAIRAELARRLDHATESEAYGKAKSATRERIASVLQSLHTELPNVTAINELALMAKRHLDLCGSSAAFDPLKAALNDASAEPALRTVLAHLVPIIVGSARRRIERGELSFDDLLGLSLRLVSSNDDVRRQLRSNHRYLFVDEFQDTDRVQFDLLQQFTRADGGGAPAALFAVGDPKQSIYGFREADVTLFEHVLQHAPHRAALTVNRRTRCDVAEWINAVLLERFAAEGADHQVAFEPLQAVRSAGEAGDGAAVSVLGLQSGAPAPHSSAEASARAEAADIAATILAAVDSDSPWQVGDPGSRRPATFGDVTILVRSRTRLGVLESVLRRAAVPYRVEGGTLIYGSREVYELLRVLRAVDDPTNELVVVGALRTSVLGVSDVELARYRVRADDPEALGRPRGWSVHTDAPGPVGEALRVIADLAARKHQRTPAEMLAALYDWSRGVAAATAEGASAARETWRRVRYAIDEARAWSDATGGTLGEYLAWVARRVEDIDRVELATDEGEDSVRIMTVHAAKGLQFPIVVIAGLGGRSAGDTQTGVRWVDGTPHLRLGRMTTQGWATHSSAAKQRELAEEARLLYVAFTRAQDHLVVSLHQQPTKSGPGASPAGRLTPAAVATIDAPGVAAPATATPPFAEPPQRVHAADDGAEPTEIERFSRQPRRVWTPSSIAKWLHDLSGPTTDLPRMPAMTDGDDEIDGDDATPRGERFGAAVAKSSSGATASRLHTDDDLDAIGLAGADADDREARDPGNRKEPIEQDRPRRLGGRYGTSKGSAVHAVMQQVSLADPSAGLGTLVQVAAESEGVAARSAEIERMVRSLIAAPLFQRMQKARRCRREMYVGAHTDGLTVWGYVDAVFENPDGTLTIVDFKTDTLVTSATELADRYRPQMSGYAWALSKATGRQVSELWLAVALPSGEPAAEVRIHPIPPSELLASLQPPDDGHATEAEGVR